MRIVALPSSSSSPLAVIRTKAIYNVCKEPSPRQQQQQQQQQQQEQMTCTTMTTKRLYHWIFSGTFCLRPVGPSLIEFRQRRVARTVSGRGGVSSTTMNDLHVAGSTSHTAVVFQLGLSFDTTAAACSHSSSMLGWRRYYFISQLLTSL